MLADEGMYLYLIIAIILILISTIIEIKDNINYGIRNIKKLINYITKKIRLFIYKKCIIYK